MERLLEPANLVQIAIIAAMVILGWWISRRVRRDLGAADAPAGWRGRAREAAWVAAPFALTLLLLATADGLLHAIRAPTRIIDVAVQLTGLLLLIRVVVYLFRVSLGTRSRIKGWGTPISIVIWVFLALHLLGWGDTLIGVLDGIGITAGKTRISVWSIAKLLVTVGAIRHRRGLGFALAGKAADVAAGHRAQHAHRARQVHAGLPDRAVDPRRPERRGSRPHDAERTDRRDRHRPRLRPAEHHRELRQRLRAADGPVDQAR